MKEKVNIFRANLTPYHAFDGGFDPLVEQGFSLAESTASLAQLVGLGEALGQCAVADQIALSATMAEAALSSAVVWDVMSLPARSP